MQRKLDHIEESMQKLATMNRWQVPLPQQAIQSPTIQRRWIFCGHAHSRHEDVQRLQSKDRQIASSHDQAVIMWPSIPSKHVVSVQRTMEVQVPSRLGNLVKAASQEEDEYSMLNQWLRDLTKQYGQIQDWPTCGCGSNFQPMDKEPQYACGVAS